MMRCECVLQRTVQFHAYLFSNSLCPTGPHMTIILIYNKIFCGVLCCAVVWCAVVWCAVVCCAVLCCAVLCCAVLCCAVLCCAVCR